MRYTHTQNGFLFSHKKEWNIAICSNMDWPREYHTETEIQMLYHLYISLKKKQMNLHTKQKYTQRYRKRTCYYQRGRGEKKKQRGRGDWAKLGVWD